MDISEMRRLLKDRRLDVVSEATGLHNNTIANIRDGSTTNPSMKAFNKLRVYLIDTSVGARDD